VGAADHNVQKVPNFKIFPWRVASATLDHCRLRNKRTALDCSVAARNFKVASADVCMISRDSMPARRPLLGDGLAEYGSFVAVEYSCLTCRFLHSRRSSLINAWVSIIRRAKEVQGQTCL
jgi:hypothetical protein